MPGLMRQFSVRELNRPMGLLVMAVAFALAAGYFESGIILFRRFALGQLAYSSIDAVWMAPVSYAVVSLIPALVLIAVSLVAPRIVTPGRAAFALATLALWSISYALFGARVHVLAYLVLAGGAAWQLAQLADRRTQSFGSAVGVIAISLTALTIALAAVLTGGRAASERLTVGRLPEPAANARNVLLIIWDTARRKNLSVYGYERPTTPFLERLASRGVVFERALSTSSWTLPSHASMFTGRLTQELSTGWRTPLDEEFPTVAEALRDRGYYTAGFVANVIAASRESGLNRGFIRYEDFRISIRETIRSSVAGRVLWRYLPLTGDLGPRHLAKGAPRITQDFLDWQQGVDRPFFAFLNFYDAHDPYYAPPELRREFRTGRGDIDRYDAALHYLDQQLDSLFSTLEQRGVLANTTVILSSDHGELFGEKGLTRHGNSLYFPLLDVPLIVWPAGDQTGRRISSAVSLRDLPATIFELATGTPNTTFPGKTLSERWTAQIALEPDTLISGIAKGVRTPPEEPVTKGNMSSLFAGSAHYILNGDGSEELYDVDRDTAMEVNLIALPEMKLMRDRFRNTLRTHVPAGWTPVQPNGAANPNLSVRQPR